MIRAILALAEVSYEDVEYFNEDLMAEPPDLPVGVTRLTSARAIRVARRRRTSVSAARKTSHPP